MTGWTTSSTKPYRTMNTSNTINFQSAFKLATDAGGARNYELFTKVIWADKTTKEHIQVINLGSKRRLLLIDADVAKAFAARYAIKHPKPNRRAKEAQMPLPIEKDPEVSLVRSEVHTLNMRLTAVEDLMRNVLEKVDHLTKIWEDKP